jgi:hypothetical protein
MQRQTSAAERIFPGEFNQAHGIAVDSNGNVYVDENRGKRVHKFKIAAQ